MRPIGQSTAALGLGLALAIPRGAPAQSPPDPVPAARALAVPAPIRLDGLPDEPVWLLADSITDFRQREPDEGAPASERTVVRILAAPDGLYLAFWNYDSRPAQIRRAQLRRDADLEDDDHVSVLIDPLRDRRTGYVFAINANGALSDGEVVSHQELNRNWNGVWDARARVTSFGWTAELFIPWQNFRYPSGTTSIGFNVRRFHRARNEEVLWRAYRRQQGILYQLEEGTLEVPGPLPARGIVEGRPYVAASSRLATREVDSTGTYGVTGSGASDAKLGFDGKLAVSSTLTLDLTANTDFAQVEADRQVVNLTRFPVFFPEKREFFLESSGIFNLGQAERTQLFHSRRIGLDSDGNVVPIRGGARLTGRMGRERIGFLALRTGGAEDAFDAVARIQHDVFDRGYVGAMGTLQEGAGAAGRRLGGGLDFTFPLLLKGQNIVPQGFIAVTRDGDGRPLATAWRLFLDYPNDWADNFLAISRIEPGFDPALGFVRQAGIRRVTGALEFFPRPRRWGVRKLVFKAIEFDINQNLDGSLNNASYEVVPLGAKFESGAEFELGLQHVDDVLTDSFEIFSGTNIAPGRYGWTRAALQVETSPAHPVVARVGLSTGRLYAGRSTDLEYELAARIEPHVILGLDGGWQQVRLATGSFTAQVHRLRLDYARSPRLGTTLFLQWDNEDDRLAVNARLHWVPMPGADAYLVWNTAWPTALPGRGGIPLRQPLNGAVVGKFVYYFRL
jgi:hypothetical protein